MERGEALLVGFKRKVRETERKEIKEGGEKERESMVRGRGRGEQEKYKGTVKDTERAEEKKCNWGKVEKRK